MSGSDRAVPQARIDLALVAAEINAHAGTEEISQKQFDYAAREMERVARLRKSGSYLVLDSAKGELGKDEVIGYFDSEKEARVHAYWRAWLACHGNRALEKGFITRYSQLLHPPEPPEEFRLNLERYKSELVKDPPHPSVRSSGVLYIFDPKGNMLDEIHLYPY